MTDTTEKKPRKTTTPTERLDNVGKRAAKSATLADKGRAKLVKTLHGWGLVATVSPPETTQELAAIASKAHVDGFTPPKATRATRAVATNDYKEGDALQLVPDFEGAYAAVYSAEERASMTYEFYDEVNKVAVIKTSSPRQMAAKLKHIQRKAVDTTGAE